MYTKNIKTIREEVTEWIESFELHSSYRDQVIKNGWIKEEDTIYYKDVETRQLCQYIVILFKESALKFVTKHRVWYTKEFNSRIWYGSRNINDKVFITILVLIDLVLINNDLTEENWIKFDKLFKRIKESVELVENEFDLEEFKDGWNLESTNRK